MGPMWLPYYFCPLSICIYTGCLNIHGTHVTVNNSTNNYVVFFFVSDLIILYSNNYLFSILMPLTREEKIFCVTTYLKTKLIKTVQEKFRRKFNLTIFLRKTKFIVRYTNFKHGVCKQPRQEIRKSQIWREFDYNTSWQCGCDERFYRKESEKVTPKTFPRRWSFTCTVR